MKAITLSTKPNSGKPALWFDGGLHAREWITVPTVTYVADRLLNEYTSGSGNNSTQMLEDFDIIICPILNVDGFDYTWNGDRMWRKTRTPNKGSPCDGTDPNRNWNFHWGEAGTSTQKCSDSYQGPSPASEVEVQAVQSYICDHKDTIKGYVNFHAYSQLWMSNWGYTEMLPADYDDQNALSASAVAAIKSVHGKTYDYGPIATTIYPASGSSADFTYGQCGVKYSYGVELRDTGEFGFLLPPSEIIPSGEEVFASVLAMATYVKAHP
jgi:murein tripeptide amidase MpaA